LVKTKGFFKKLWLPPGAAAKRFVLPSEGNKRVIKEKINRKFRENKL